MTQAHDSSPNALAALPDPVSPMMQALVALASGTTPDPDALASLESAAGVSGDQDTGDGAGDTPLAKLLSACREVGRLGGAGGGALARILAEGYAPVAVADLAQRAQITHGRDADRLWAGMQHAAGLDRPPAQAQVAIQVNVYGPGGYSARLKAAEPGSREPQGAEGDQGGYG